MKIIDMLVLPDTNPERDVEFDCGMHSVRGILAADNMGFSVHRTIIPKGPARHWCYKDHLEACYCVAGHGLLVNLATGERYTIYPDMMYVLDKHDDHTFQAISDTVLISIFNPPCVGDEKHDANGAYSIGEKL